MTLSFDPERLARLDKHLARFVDDGRLVGWQLALMRDGRIEHESLYGWRDREAHLPVEADTLWRIASMTKPVVSVAALTLWEEGFFELTDPVSKWIPSFADARVYRSGMGRNVVTEPVAEPLRVWHLMAHTSGLTAGWIYDSPVDALYRDAGYEIGMPPEAQTLADCVEDWARLPLMFQPGTRWGYGVSHEVLGRLVEIWTGQPLDVALSSRVLDPLGMKDTVFWCDDSRRNRLAALYLPNEEGTAVRADFTDAVCEPPRILSGGGGLLSTMQDYLRFTQMLAQEGRLDGTQLLSPTTVRLLCADHLPPAVGAMSTAGFPPNAFDGVRFGLGVAVVVDPIASHSPGNRGEFYWGGITSTLFWVDPLERLSCVFMTQLWPARTYPLRSQLRQMVYGALVPGDGFGHG